MCSSWVEFLVGVAGNRFFIFEVSEELRNPKLLVNQIVVILSWFDVETLELADIFEQFFYLVVVLFYVQDNDKVALVAFLDYDSFILEQRF